MDDEGDEESLSVDLRPGGGEFNGSFSSTKSNSLVVTCSGMLAGGVEVEARE